MRAILLIPVLMWNERVKILLEAVSNHGRGEYRGIAFRTSDVTIGIDAELTRDGRHVSWTITVAGVPLDLVERRLDDHFLVIDEEMYPDLIVGGAGGEIIQPAGMGIGAHPLPGITGVMLGVGLRSHGDAGPIVGVVGRNKLHLDDEVRGHKDRPRQTGD